MAGPPTEKAHFLDPARLILWLMGPQYASPTVSLGWVETNEGSGSINNLVTCHVVSDLVDKTIFSETDKLHISKTQSLISETMLLFQFTNIFFLLALPNYA